MSKPIEYVNTNFVMFLRAIIFNAACISLVAYIYQDGRIDAVLKFDTLYISRTIAGLGILSLGAIIIRIFQISRELNIVKKYRQLMDSGGDKRAADEWFRSTNSRAAEFIQDYRRVLPEDKSIFVENFKMIIIGKLSIFIATIQWATTVGLLGTVVGFRLALEIMPSLKDINLLATLTQKMSGGLMIAIDTTIVGICVAIWLDVNLRWILQSGTRQLVSEAINAAVLHHE